MDFHPEVIEFQLLFSNSTYNSSSNGYNESYNSYGNNSVIYAEIRFAPLKHVFKGLSLDEVVESVLKGLAKKSLKTNLILCMMRGDKEEDNIKVVDLAERFLNRGVVALDLAGAESIYKTIDYKNLFAYAKGKNIPFTTHAGEADGKDSMKQL